MTIFPDIIREAKIVSGKDQIAYVKECLLSMTSSTSGQNNNNNTYFEETAVSDEIGDNSRLLVKKKMSSSATPGEKPSFLPNLIFNDRNRSSAYFRTTRSTDFLNVKSSPLATRLLYNWTPLERETSKSVQSKVKLYKPPKRIAEPARPPPPFKVKTMYETIDPHHHNEKRALEMKRLNYLKDHTEWSIYPYAAIEERENYNKKIRDTLKEQISQKDRQIQAEFEKNLMEIKFVMEKDQNTVIEDQRRKVEKAKYLTSYRNDNQQLMQDRWMHDYISKRHEWHQESQLLEQDPINWSKTLK